MYRDYDHIRFVYETEIQRYEQDALAKAAERACNRSAMSHGYEIIHGLGFAFRVIDVSYSTIIDADREEYGTNTKLEIVAFPVIKVTPTGFRICRGCRGDGAPETRFISTAWNKQWASCDPRDALKSYIARRKRQAAIYERKAQKARWLVREAERLLKPADLMPVV